MNTNTKTVPIMLGIKETAANFGITKNHVRHLALSGAVKAVRIGSKGKILINQQSLAEYFDNAYITTEKAAPSGLIKPISERI